MKDYPDGFTVYHSVKLSSRQPSCIKIDFMTSRATNTEPSPSSQARRPTSSSNMELFDSSPASSTPRVANPQVSSSPAAQRASNTRAALPSAVRSPARLSNSAPSRLPASSQPNRNVAAAVVSSTSSSQSSVARQAAPISTNQLQNTPAALAVASVVSPPSGPSSQVICKTSSDCASKICISGVCQTNSGFALSVSASSPPNSVSSLHHIGGYKSKFGTPTACSDPRCTLPAAITSLNGAEEKDISASLGSHQRAVSSAATAGIVLAFLFATLAVLLVVPRIRDWARRCFGCNKEDNGVVLDDGSPEFGNHHASAFINEKRRTIGTMSNGSYSDNRSRSRNGHNQEYSEYDEYLPGYEGGQGDIADVKVDLKQEEYFHGDYYNAGNGGYNQQYNVNHGAPVLPTLDYDRSQSTRDLASYVEHNPAPPLPSSISAPMQLSRATPAPAQYVPPVSKPANITPWASKGRDTAVRETVLPYTVEEDRDALVGLRSLGTPTVKELASNQ